MQNNLAKGKKEFDQVLGSAFVRNLSGLEVFEVGADFVTLKMTVDDGKHINSIEAVHGGALMSICDTAMSCACFNLGRRVTTLDLNINFIKAKKPGGYLTVKGSVLHNGRKTLVTEADVYDDDGKLVAKARGTFFVVGEA